MLSLGVFPLIPPGLYDCVIFGGLYPSNSESRPQLHLYLLFFFGAPGEGISRGVLLWALVFLGEEIILFPLTQPPAAAMSVSWALSICS